MKLSHKPNDPEFVKVIGNLYDMTSSQLTMIHRVAKKYRTGEHKNTPSTDIVHSMISMNEFATIVGGISSMSEIKLNILIRVSGERIGFLEV